MEEEDDFSRYFAWQSTVQAVEREKGIISDDTYNKDGGESIRTGNDLANCLRKMEKIPKFERKSLTPEELQSLNLPMNREVELIMKWKEVEKSQDELQIVRGHYATKKEEFSKRWKKIEKGQLEMKQNMVTYNNIVKDKQGKVADGMSRRMMEKQKQTKLKAKKQKVDKTVKFYQEAKDTLKKSVDNKKLFNEYLESVLQSSGKMFEGMDHLIGRCRALVETRKDM